jgi:hypothetical protein
MSVRAENMVRVFERIASYLKTIDPACVYGVEETEDSVLTAVFYVAGFDGFMLSEVQRIASQHSAKVGFNVEPYSSKALKLTLVIEVVEE